MNVPPTVGVRRINRLTCDKDITIVSTLLETTHGSRLDDGERQGAESRGGAAAPAGPLSARAATADRGTCRLRYEPVRRLHGAGRRPQRQVLHHLRHSG